MSKKKALLFFLIGAVFILFLNIYKTKISNFLSKAISRSYIFSEPLFSQNNKQNNTLWLNIFVHGTVGCVFSFLDISSIQGDRIENSIYKKTVKLMRRNHFFYQDQPILQKGLVKIEPSFDFITRNDQYYAAYPVLKAFEESNNWLNKNNEDNLFYLFGWSGYLSQKRRRSEAIRLYNQLAEEIQLFKNNGINPKIRILSHSHGGNLVLNLAGIHHYLTKTAETFYEDFEIGGYIKEAFDKLLNNSFEKELAITKKGQKRFDYFPHHKDFIIDEVVLLGTPIQEETSLFVTSPFFKKTYNIYSDGDIIQGIDFATTIKKKSLQRIDGLQRDNLDFYQIKIAMNCLSQANQKDKLFKNRQHTPFWKVLLGFKDTSRKSADPTHKELWFIVPNDGSTFNFLRPVPTVSYYPFIKHLQAGINSKDCILEISQEAEGYNFRIYDINDSSISNQLLIPNSFIDGIQDKFVPWVNPRNGAQIMKGIMSQLIKINRKISEGF